MFNTAFVMITIIEHYPPESEDAWVCRYGLARLMLELGDYDAAVSYANMVYLTRPHDKRSPYVLAMCLRESAIHDPVLDAQTRPAYHMAALRMFYETVGRQLRPEEKKHVQEYLDASTSDLQELIGQDVYSQVIQMSNEQVMYPIVKRIYPPAFHEGPPPPFTVPASWKLVKSELVAHQAGDHVWTYQFSVADQETRLLEELLMFEGWSVTKEPLRSMPGRAISGSKGKDEILVVLLRMEEGKERAIVRLFTKANPC